MRAPPTARCSRGQLPWEIRSCLRYGRSQWSRPDRWLPAETTSLRCRDADESVECLCLVVRLYPGAHSQRLAIYDVAFKDRSVGHQNFRAAIGQNAAHFGEREQRVQRNRDASGADDGQKPMKTLPVIGAIDGDRLAGTQCDRTAEEGIDGADVGMQIGEMKMAVLADGDFAISLCAEATRPRDWPP